MKLGEYIREYRTEHNLSQRQFAIECDLSNGYISILEKGINPKTQRPVTPTLPQLKKIADGMRISLSELLEQIDDMPVDLSSGNIPVSFSQTELFLLDSFRSLNLEGQEKVLAYIEDLSRTGIYKNSDKSILVSKKA